MGTESELVDIVGNQQEDGSFALEFLPTNIFEMIWILRFYNKHFYQELE